jgi:hypothetical protein
MCHCEPPHFFIPKAGWCGGVAISKLKELLFVDDEIATSSYALLAMTVET